jgi:hypothetical protein
LLAEVVMSFALQNTGAYRGYSDKPFPLGSYALLLCGFTGTFGLLLGRTRRARPPSAPEVVLLGLATHKLTRLIARDSVTAVVRAPFTRFVSDAPASEVDERSRGHGMQKAVGQLLGCQYCLGPWVASALTFAHALWPKPTRRPPRWTSAPAGAGCDGPWASSSAASTAWAPGSRAP